MSFANTGYIIIFVVVVAALALASASDVCLYIGFYSTACVLVISFFFVLFFPS